MKEPKVTKEMLDEITRYFQMTHERSRIYKFLKEFYDKYGCFGFYMNTDSEKAAERKLKRYHWYFKSICGKGWTRLEWFIEEDGEGGHILIAY